MYYSKLANNVLFKICQYFMNNLIYKVIKWCWIIDKSLSQDLKRGQAEEYKILNWVACFSSSMEQPK